MFDFDKFFTHLRDIVINIFLTKQVLSNLVNALIFQVTHFLSIRNRVLPLRI